MKTILFTIATTLIVAAQAKADLVICEVNCRTNNSGFHVLSPKDAHITTGLRASGSNAVAIMDELKNRCIAIRDSRGVTESSLWPTYYVQYNNDYLPATIKSSCYLQSSLPIR